jgi:predicted dehydrogenase
MRVLVVGHGLIGKQRAAALFELSASGAATLAGTVDPVARAASLYGGAPHFARFEDAPEESYDAAVVALPHDVAPAVASAVLAARKPILIEKPLGRTAPEARALVEAARGASLPSFVGYNYRFIPNVAEALARAARGELGTLRSVDVLLGHGGHPRAAEGWKLRPERAGGGVLIDPGVHLLDLLLQLEPALALEYVTATRGFWPTSIEEDLAAVFRHESLVATLRVSLVRWVNTFRLELGGEDGYALVDGRGGNYGPLELRVGKRWAWNDGRGRSQRETEEARDFGPADPSLARELRAVVARWTGAPADDEPAPATLEDGLRVAELCDAMYRRLEAS